MIIIHENAQCRSILNCELIYCMSKCCLIFIIGLEWQLPVMTVIFFRLLVQDEVTITDSQYSQA